MPFSAARDLWLVLKARDEGTRALRSFSRDIRMVGDTVRVANLQAAKSAAVNQMAIMRLSGATADDMLIMQRHIQTLDQQIHTQRIARAAAEEHRVSMQRLSSSLYGVSAAAGVAGLGLIALGGIGLRGMFGLVQSTINYEKQAALTRTQVDKFRYSLQQIEKVGLDLARVVPVPFEEIQPALYDIFSSMEVGLEDATKLLEIFSRAAVAGQTSIQGASRATIGIMNAFHLPISSVNHLMDVQFQLVQEGIGTYDEWVKRIGLVTPSAVRAGQSVEMMAAALAASTRMGIPAANSASAVARALDALSHPTAIKAMKQMGITVTDAHGRFLPMIDILGQFRTKLSNIPKYEDRIKKIVEVFKGAGGTIQARRFLQNMLLTPGNLELFKTIFQEMSKDSGSFEEAYSIMANTTAGKTQLLRNQWEALKVDAGAVLAPAFTKVIGYISKAIEWFNKLNPETKKTIINWMAIGFAISIVGGILVLMLGIFAAFAAAVATAGATVFIVLGAVVGLGAALIVLGIILKRAWDRSSRFRDILIQIGDTAKRIWTESIVPTAKGIKDAFNKHIAPALSKVHTIMYRDVLPIFEKLQKFMMGEVLDTIKEVSNWIKEGLTRVFQFIGYIIDHMVIPAINRLTQFYRQHEETIKQVVGWLMESAKWGLKIGVVVGVILLAAFVALIAIIFAVITVFVSLVLGIIYVVEWVKKLIKWFGDFGKHMGWLKDHVLGIWNVIVTFFKNLGLNIKDLILDAISDMADLGIKMIRGLINGFESMMGVLKDYIFGLGGKVLGWLGDKLGITSPSKEFAKLGALSARGYIKGWQDSMPSIIGTMGASGNAALSSVSRGSGNSSNVPITIYTQEIDPRRHAAELGWLLSGSI